MKPPKPLHLTTALLVMSVVAFLSAHAKAAPISLDWPETCEEDEAFVNPLDPESVCTSSGTVIEIVGVCLCKADCDPGGSIDFSVECHQPD